MPRARRRRLLADARSMVEPYAQRNNKKLITATLYQEGKIVVIFFYIDNEFQGDILSLAWYISSVFMRHFYFKKLVRDGVIENMLADATQHPKHRKLDDEEFYQELAKKLVEESSELLKAPTDERLEELADVYEVLQAMMSELRVSESDLQQAVEAKLQKRGGFEKRAYVDYIDVDDDCKWIDYYLEQPEKYPELEGKS